MMSYKNISNFLVKFLKDLGNDLNTDEWQEKIAECSGDDEVTILKRRNYGVQLMHQVLCAAYFKTARIVTNGAGIIGSFQNDITSLESLARDETFLCLESLVRLFPKVSQNIV